MSMVNDWWANLLLRIGVAFAFLYPPISALSNPESWIGYFPPFVEQLLASLSLTNEAGLHIFGAIEVGIALWILSGWKIFWPATLATLALLGIVIFNPSEFEILFRDLSIAAASLALALSAWHVTKARQDRSS